LIDCFISFSYWKISGLFSSITTSALGCSGPFFLGSTLAAAGALALSFSFSATI